MQGCKQVLEQDSSAVGIFVSPPSRDNLEKRLRARGTETEESIRVRLANVAGEVDQAYSYHYVIIHQDWSDVPNALEIAAEEVYDIIRASRGDADAGASAQACLEANRREFLDALAAGLRA